MAMGRGSDTRMYAPRSESSQMYSSANEDENKYNPTSPEDNEKRAEEKKLKEEETKRKAKEIKHIQIKPSQGLGAGPGLETEPGLDDGNKRDDEREIGLQGGPAGSRGHLLDLATGAKTGTGSAMGTGNSAVRTGEPMDGAWSTLLKEEPTVHPGENQYKHRYKMPNRDDVHPEWYDWIQETLDNPAEYEGIADDFQQPDINHLAGATSREEFFEKLYDSHNFQVDDARPPFDDIEGKYRDFTDVPFNDETSFTMSEPMDGAWSTLLKGNEPWELNYNKILSQGGDWDDYEDAYGPSLPSGASLNDEEEWTDEDRDYLDMSSEDQKHYDKAMYINGLHSETKSCAGCKAEFATYHPKTVDAIQEGLMHEDDAPEQIYGNDMLEEGIDGMPGKYDTSLCNHCSNVFEENKHHFWDSGDNFIQPPPEIMNQMNNEFSQSPIAGMGVDDVQQHIDKTSNTEIQTGEPMDNAWSTLLKRDTPGIIEGRRRREKRREFRPSTGQFKRPPGGQTPVGATMRRFRAHMRGIKGGKKTGLMKPHLAVEMSHRGIATKQPMSKDPQKYRQYMGQQEAKKILGNVRTTYSPHARHSARSFTAGPTGGGRLTGLLPGQSGQMSRPSLRPMRRPRMPRMPRMPTPQMPSMPQMAPPMSSVPSMPAPQSSSMMSDERTQSELLKSNRHANRVEMIQLMRMLVQAQRAKANMKKSKPNFYDGNVPDHPSPVHSNEDEEEKNDGPTQNLETNSSRLGLDPAGYLSGKRGHMG